MAGRYADQDPATVAAELVERGRRRSRRPYGGVEGRAVGPPGPAQQRLRVHRRTLARYHLHDVEHHLHDVVLTYASAPCGTRSSGPGWSDALGPAYARTWAEQQVISDLGDRTVTEALDAGEPPKQVWRAVWERLELPAVER